MTKGHLAREKASFKKLLEVLIQTLFTHPGFVNSLSCPS